jgi:cellulose synthase/poly-beta-1,6-N-acetylglucosamine synthase-like glycosyltransferase
VARGRFFDRPTHNTGFVIDWTEGRTGNVLFRRRILNGVDEPFRAKFGSGGEDRDFFRRMIERGCIFAWCDEAVVHEVVPPVRWKRTFMLKRALLRGKVSLSHKNAGTRDVAKSALAIPLYSLALPFLLVVGHHRFMKYLIKLFDHAGRILAFLGFNPVRETYVTE